MALRRRCSRASVADPPRRRHRLRAPRTASDLVLTGHPAQITQEFGWLNRVTPFRTAGVMSGRNIWSREAQGAAPREGPNPGDVLLLPEDEVPREFFIRETQLPQWRYLEAEREERVAANGHVSRCSKAGTPTQIAPTSRRVADWAGGTSPSRFKHVVDVRRPVPSTGPCGARTSQRFQGRLD